MLLYSVVFCVFWGEDGNDGRIGNDGNYGGEWIIFFKENQKMKEKCGKAGDFC